MYKEYVNHPRYGNKPTYSGLKFTADEILNSYWAYEKDSIFPESGIEADISKQNYSSFPREIYVDIEKQCKQCNRWFIFFAKEQQYWYETLGFYIDVDCVKCIECRKKEQMIKLKMHEYEELVKNSHRIEKETNKLKNIALELFQMGYIRDRNKIGNIG